MLATQTQATPAVIADSSAPTPSTPTSVATKSPLDVLDEILNEAKAKNQVALEERQKAEERLVQEALEQQKQADQQHLAEELEKLKAETQSPEYQAKVAQDQQVATEQQQKAEEMKGHEIVQLNRTQV